MHGPVVFFLNREQNAINVQSRTSNQTKYNPQTPLPKVLFQAHLRQFIILDEVLPVSLKYSHQTVLWQKINRDKINVLVPSRDEAENICAPLTAEGTNLQEGYQ